MTKVWGPGRDKASQTPTATFDYRVSTNEASAVTARTLNSAGEYTQKSTFYDGLLRERSAQSTAAGVAGGRVITHKVYDARGQLITDAGPYYDSQSPSQSMVIETNEGEISNLARYSYDRLGRPTKERTVSMNEVLFESTTAYAGDRVKVTPPDGGTPRTTVTDVRGRTTSITEHEGATASGPGQVTTYAYTPGGQLAEVENSSGTSWSKEYDVRGRLVRDDDPDKGVTTYTYDSLDRQVTSTDARGVTLWTGYDVLGRKTALRDDDSSGTLRSSWAYDSVQPGRLSSATRHTADGDFVSEVTAYDGAGRATSQRLLVPESEGLLSRAGGYVTGTSYEPDGSVSVISQPSVSGALPENLSYVYDSIGNPLGLIGRAAIVSEVTYAHDGRVLGKVYGSNLGTSFASEARQYEAGTQRLTKRWVSFPQAGSSPATKLIDLEYGYDDAGNVTRIDDVAGSTPWRQCFEYDFLRRLTQAWTTSTTDCAAPTASNTGTTDAYRVSYGFAANGNRKSMSRTTGSGGSAVTKVSGSTFPDPAAGDRPHAVEATSVLGGPVESFAYDEVGNLTSRETKTAGQVTAGQQIEWDREGRQKTVTDTKTGKKVEYLYDADGSRLLERDETNGSTTLWVGNTQITLKGGTLSTTRNYSLGGEPVATRTGSTLSWVIGDHHDTPVLSMDVAARTSSKRRFDPYGLPLTTGGAWPNDRGFVNQRTDTTTGTTHLGAREYDPAAGRFTSVDPVADFMNPQQLNAYAYSNNSPVTYTDPDGDFFFNPWAVRSFFNAVRSIATSYSIGYGIRRATSLWSAPRPKAPARHPALAAPSQKTGDGLGPPSAKTFAKVGAYAAAGVITAGACVGTLGLGCAATAVGTGALATAYAGRLDDPDRSLSATGKDAATGGILGLLGVGVGAGLSKGIAAIAARSATSTVGSAAPSTFIRTEALSGRASQRTVDEIAESMRTNGWQGPPIEVVELQSQRIVVDGHHRLAAARRVGIDVQYKVVDPSSVIGPGKYTSIDDILKSSYSVGRDRLR